MIVPVPLPLLAAAGGVLIVAGGLGAWRINDGAYDRAVAATDAKWQQVAAKAAADAQALAVARQQHKDDSETLDALRTRSTAATLAPIFIRSDDHAKTPDAAARCLSGDGLRIANDAITAAAAAVTPGAVGRSVSAAPAGR